MANDEHIARLMKGVNAWNAWRDENPGTYIDLSGANLMEAFLCKADLSTANLSRANLSRANLSDAKLWRANLEEADLSRANLHWAILDGASLWKASLIEADLSQAKLMEAHLARANLSRANLSRAFLVDATLTDADLSGADLSEATLHAVKFWSANLSQAKLTKADLSHARLSKANLTKADLSGANLNNAGFFQTLLREANLSEAHLEAASLVNSDLSGADLTGCSIWGIAAWDLKLEEAKQQNLIIEPLTIFDPVITVDNIEVAQFIYLLLHNEKIRDVIDTIGKKGVLLLGRFTEGRIQILERLREKLRGLGFVPMVFNFDKPETKDFTETVRLLANLSHFVIVDITNPRSAPLELQATVPDYMVPFVPILQQGEEPFSMFVDLQNKYDWVLKPVRGYSSVDQLIKALEEKIVRPAEAKFNELLARRTQQLRVENV